MQSEKKKLSTTQRAVQFIRDCIRSNDYVDEMKNVPKNETDSDKNYCKVYCHDCDAYIKLPRKMTFVQVDNKELNKVMERKTITAVSATTTTTPVNTLSTTGATNKYHQPEYTQVCNQKPQPFGPRKPNIYKNITKLPEQLP